MEDYFKLMMVTLSRGEIGGNFLFLWGAFLEYLNHNVLLHLKTCKQ